MFAFLKFYLTQNLRQINALGIEFDKTVNVLSGGIFGQTVSYRAAWGAGWRYDADTGGSAQIGAREPGWCLFCWFLGTFVQKGHCMLQFVKGPSNWLTWVRAGIAFGAGLWGLYVFARWLLHLLFAHPEAGVLVIVVLGLAAFQIVLVLDQTRKDLK
jgi:hypothetical protein